jgi:putative transposase
MPRAARIVIPDVPHHIIQRGNRRQDVFFSDEDMLFYLRLLLNWSQITELSIWAYCLMRNHIHCVAVPLHKTSLSRCFAEVHKRYAQVVNERHGWQGHLWQERFHSYPMDEAYKLRAMRYIELNPLRAGIADDPLSYPWSSARAHVLNEWDPLLSGNPTGMTGEDWSRFLAEGLIEAEYDLFRSHTRTERPLGGEDFLKKHGLL